MLPGRTAELKHLNTYYDQDGSQIMVVYGQKNVGKTQLLKDFVEDKSFYYYHAKSASEREQRYLWGAELGRKDIKLSKYPSFTDIFEAIIENKGAKKVIILDEFQYIVKSSDNFMSELVSFVHNNWQTQNLMVVLVSSSIGWVENSMINKIGDAAYELSSFLKVKELSFESITEHFAGFSIEQCIEAYAVLGGIPGLWAYFNDKLSVKENIIRSILSPMSLLNQEGQRIVEEELRETGVYNTILASIAQGNHKLNDLYMHTDFSRAKISVYLKNLMELELVEKVFSYDTEGKENTQKGIYRISNHFVNFYFTYIYPNLTDIENITPGDFYKEYVAPTFRTYVSDYFKTVCRQHIEKWNKWGQLPIQIDRIGEWVGKLGNIDVIAQNSNGDTIVAICNWDKPMMRYDDYEWLMFCCKEAKIKVDYIYLFSVRRFDEKLNLEAKVKSNLKLISLDEM
ncbi:MAG: ATP-binding protein [Lachnospiraceae bacterium]|nr:ATP-binding protein [Lachnospiraceae bacterium]